jgi:predicted RNase H-like nuclease (RuvC/YqgF family)
MESQTQNQHQEVVTRSELNFIRATDALKLLNSKMEVEISELKKSVTARESQIKSQDATISNLQSDNNRLRRELETKNDTIVDNKCDLAELKSYVSRVSELERTLSSINKRHESDLEIKKMIITRQEKDIVSLKETIEQLEDELEELDEDETNDETEELEEGGELTLEEGGIVGEGLEQYQMPEDYVQVKKDAILKLVDGGNLSLKKIEALTRIKENLGGQLGNEPVLTEKEQTEKAIHEGLKKGNGRIPENELIKIKGVTLNKDGIVVLAKGGELNLHRNFLSPSFSLIPQKK